jgi:signal transduction histidine kinase
MTNWVPGIESPLFIVYLLGFGMATVACFASAHRARRISDPDTRRGLVALLVTSGGWAFAQFLFLIVPSVQLKTAAYIVGLVVGFSTVGPWLYFCSAYTGRSIHRNTKIQRSAVGIFLTVVAVKVTNPVHQLYFTAELATDPFSYLAVQNGLFHWVVVALAYALATVGYFMLFELFWQVDNDSLPLVGLIGLTGLPIIPNLVVILRSDIPEITFEPIGVAIFAVGVLFLYIEEFQSLQLTEGRDDPVIILDDDDRVREYNTAAETLFSDLTTGARLTTVVPEMNDQLTEDDILEVDRIGGLRYYHLSSTPFTTDLSRLGEVITLTDVTDREQYRVELERQNERLEQFANTVSHDLRNPLNVAQLHLDLARENRDDDDLEKVTNALTRMDTIIEDVLTLARNGQPIDETESVSLATVATASWDVIESKGAELSIEDDAQILADPARLQQLLENLFRNAIEHGGENVVIRVGGLDDESGFYLADNGVGISAEDRESVFESGYSTAEDGTGFGLAIVKEIADAHGWNTRILESRDGGVRFEFDGTTEIADSAW